jgi:hypothetical protein
MPEFERLAQPKFILRRRNIRHGRPTRIAAKKVPGDGHGPGAICELLGGRFAAAERQIRRLAFSRNVEVSLSKRERAVNGLRNKWWAARCRTQVAGLVAGSRYLRRLEGNGITVVPEINLETWSLPVAVGFIHNHAVVMMGILAELLVHMALHHTGDFLAAFGHFGSIRIDVGFAVHYRDDGGVRPAEAGTARSPQYHCTLIGRNGRGFCCFHGFAIV